MLAVAPSQTEECPTATALLAGAPAGKPLPVSGDCQMVASSRTSVTANGTYCLLPRGCLTPARLLAVNLR